MPNSALNSAYLVLLAMLIVPQYKHVHPYLHLMIMAPLLVWIGCQRALLEKQKKPEDSQMEVLTKKDAMQFPLIGSAVLFGLYVVVKFVDKAYIDMLISGYFALLGAGGLFQCAVEPLTALLGMGGLGRKQVCVHWQYWKKAEKREPIEFSFSAFDLALFGVSCGLALWYSATKKWWLNNLLGSAFAIQGIELLSLGSFVIGCILLAGLFVYDVFWVFGTEVMVAVAKGLNAPVKIMFPKALGVTPIPFSMLGLGDIVIPGIFVALMLRFDHKHGFTSTPYFYANFVAYVLGLVTTVGVMHVFDAAQPALLYLVPACIGAALLTAVSRGELQLLLNYSEEKPEEQAAAEEKKGK
jgi:minor histocompatibility antigen H13